MSCEVSLDELMDSVLQVGQDDWISLGDVTAVLSYYRRIERDDIDAMVAEVERLVRELVVRGLVVIGNDVYAEGDFRPFDGDQEAGIAWLVGVLREQHPSWPFAAWMANTPLGDSRVADRPLTRYHADDDPTPDSASDGDGAGAPGAES